jgi:hypothetical protein
VRSRLVGAVLGLLLLPLLSACGGGQGYCDTVKADQSKLGGLINAGGSTALLQALPIFEDLHDSAPGDVAADWQLVVTRLEALQAALAAAHVDPSTYDPRHPPADLSSADRHVIRQAAAALAAGDTVQALQAVSQEVLDVCHTPLSL